MSAPTTETVPYYPVRVAGDLDQPLSRWLWLVKWLLVIPHYFVLFFLWIAVAVLWVVTLFAILFTGRYPRACFDFTLGVMRWSWRVSYYSYTALGTDRYPPFSLGAEPDYPARLDVDPPGELSRGLVLVKWWLLAIPHYVIVGIFAGGGSWLGSRTDDSWVWGWGAGGLIGILVLIAAVILLFTGGYPTSLYDVIMGMNRWSWRVTGYALLMTDRYPPFRLDLGGHDPAGPVSPGAPTAGPGAAAESPAGSPVVTDRSPVPLAGTGTGTGTGTGPVTGRNTRWTPGLVATLVCGGVAAVIGVGLLVPAAVMATAAAVSRDDDGFLTSPEVSITSNAYAMATESIDLGDANGPDWAVPGRVLGDARFRVTPQDPSRPVFIGVADTADVQRYLAGVRYDTLRTLSNKATDRTERQGGAPGTPPQQQAFWTEQVSGTGAQTLSWRPTTGDWTIVVMNADASAGLDVDADVAATVPALGWITTGLVVVGLLFLALATVLIIVAVRGASVHPTSTPPGRPAPTSV